MTKPQNFRAWLALCHDLAATALAWAAMYLVRFNLDFREPYLADMMIMLAWILPLQGTIFVAFGLYRGLWRFASLLDLQRIVFAAGLGALLIPLVLVMLQLHLVVPRSVLLFYPIMLIFVMAGDRFAYRIWKEHRLYSPLAALGEPVLVIGAGEAGARLTREFARSRQWRVVGLVDDDPAKHGRMVHNVTVLGPISSLPGWARKYGVRQVIIALPSAPGMLRQQGQRQGLDRSVAEEAMQEQVPERIVVAQLPPLLHTHPPLEHPVGHWSQVLLTGAEVDPGGHIEPDPSLLPLAEPDEEAVAPLTRRRHRGHSQPAQVRSDRVQRPPVHQHVDIAAAGDGIFAAA